MGAHGDGFRVETRRGKRVFVIDFWYRDQAGERRRCKHDADVQTATGARVEAARWRALCATQGAPPKQAPALTFRTFVEGVWREQWAPRFKPSTRLRYDEMLDNQGMLDTFGSTRLDAIDASAVTAFAARIKATGVQSWPHVSLVSSILRAAVALNLLPVMPRLPAAGKPKRKLPKCPSDEDVAGILRVARGWLHTACALSSLAGLRSGEVRALEAGDVSLRRGEIVVCRAMSADEVSTTKSDEDRVVPISPALDPILRKAIKGKLPCERVILTRNGSTPSRQNILWRLQRTEKRHGLRAWSFHALRHYFCTSLIRHGANLPSVQLVAGHQDIATTMQYVHPEMADARAAMDRIGTPAAHASKKPRKAPVKTRD
jgi:integrase